MIIITASVLARPETLADIRAASLAHVARSRTEDGCLEHGVAADCENALRLVFTEKWRDAAAVAKHFADPHARAFAARVRDLAAAPPVLELFEAQAVSPAALRD